jgi:hypothetical protein
MGSGNGGGAVGISWGNVKGWRICDFSQAEESLVRYCPVQVTNKFNGIRGAVIVPLFLCLGGPSNLVNMAVFYKHGLKHRINVCLFALSAVDFCYTVFIFFMYADSLTGYDAQHLNLNVNKFGDLWSAYPALKGGSRR